MALSESPQIDLIKKVVSLLKVLSKEDALMIFWLAKNGMKAETSKPSNTRLTREQYYTRLNQLKSSGSIEKMENNYFHTTLGSYMYEKCIFQALEAVNTLNPELK